jgi:hypothetical protein
MEKSYVEQRDGGYWITGTRISLDSIVYAFKRGAAPESMHRAFPHSPGFSGKGYPYSAKPSGGEDLDVEEPVVCWHAPAFHLHPTLPSMLGAPLIRDQVVQVQPPAPGRPTASGTTSAPRSRRVSGSSRVKTYGSAVHAIFQRLVHIFRTL